MDSPELERIVDLCQRGAPWVTLRECGRVEYGGTGFPLLGLTIGSRDRSAPTLGLFGGVHGLERIGSHVVLNALESLVARLSWDRSLQQQLERARIVSMPVINPVGIARQTRANGNGVDLMRNAPVDAQGAVTPLVGGHRIGSWLPWYRGAEGEPMQVESQALIDFVAEEMFDSTFGLALDIHSGFGFVDRLWYPYARQTGGYEQESACARLGDRLAEYDPHHVYRIEPQAKQYTTHGDLWDYAFERHRCTRGETGNVFLPWTLEMGSWAWVRKNPLQVFQALGFFNPIKPHRYARTMRRHARLVEFLWSVLLSGPEILSSSQGAAKLN
ncbi:MAG: M14 family zinc carboxypeptidase [Myxococcota bacterium]|nr:M14 family zinc carboxypeptidase [Myxococcota bacterium]